MRDDGMRQRQKESGGNTWRIDIKSDFRWWSHSHCKKFFILLQEEEEGNKRITLVRMLFCLLNLCFFSLPILKIENEWGKYICNETDTLTHTPHTNTRKLFLYVDLCLSYYVILTINMHYIQIYIQGCKMSTLSLDRNQSSFFKFFDIFLWTIHTYTNTFLCCFLFSNDKTHIHKRNPNILSMFILVNCK